MAVKAERPTPQEILPSLRYLYEALKARNVGAATNLGQAERHLRAALPLQDVGEQWISASMEKTLLACLPIAREGEVFKDDVSVFSHIETICGWAKKVIAQERPVIIKGAVKKKMEGYIHTIEGVLEKLGQETMQRHFAPMVPGTTQVGGIDYIPDAAARLNGMIEEGLMPGDYDPAADLPPRK